MTDEQVKVFVDGCEWAPPTRVSHSTLNFWQTIPLTNFTRTLYVRAYLMIPGAN